MIARLERAWRRTSVKKLLGIGAAILFMAAPASALAQGHHGGGHHRSHVSINIGGYGYGAPYYGRDRYGDPYYSRGYDPYYDGYRYGSRYYDRHGYAGHDRHYRGHRRHARHHNRQWRGHRRH